MGGDADSGLRSAVEGDRTGAIPRRNNLYLVGPHFDPLYSSPDSWQVQVLVVDSS